MPQPPRLEQTRRPDGERTRGLVSSRKSGRRIDAASYEPPEELREYVERFWVGRWSLPAEEPHETQLLSDPCVHLVFEQSDQRSESRVVGVWTKLWTRKLAGTGCVRGVKFKAGMGAAVLPAPISQWSDKQTPLSAIFGEEVRDVESAVWEREDQEALSFLGEFVQGKADISEEAMRAREIVELIQASPSLLRVEDVASRIGMNLRALQRLFRTHVGASPKWLIRRQRLQEVATRIDRGHLVNLASLAADLGYSDQAHLARDFKAAVGRSPGAIVKQRTDDASST